MKVIRSIKTDGNVKTNLCSYLTQIKDNKALFFNHEHSLKHPLAIYNVSASRFFASCETLMDILGSQNTGNPLKQDFFLPTKELFDSFCSHLDDIYTIFKCFFPVSSVTKEVNFADGWLSRATKNNQICRNAITEFDNNISFCEDTKRINNKLKHNHGRIHEIFVKTLRGKAIGFFIEAVNSSGTILPDEGFHKKFNNDSTAFSYNWLLLEILAQFYFVDNYAAKSLRKIIMGLHSDDMSLERIEIDNSRIVDIYNKLDNTLSHILFADEYAKEISQIQFDGDTLIIKKPADKSFSKRFIYQSQYSVGLLLHQDGITTKFIIPYGPT